MNTQIPASRRGQTQTSLDGVKWTSGAVDAAHLIALAESWERCAQADIEDSRRAAEGGDVITMSFRSSFASLYQRHAQELRRLVEASMT